MVVSILVSVKRPVTRAGLMSNVAPCPLTVEMFALKEPRDVPPLKTPPAQITHDAPVPVALKLPLDCAKAVGATAIANAIANDPTNTLIFICFIYSPSELGQTFECDLSSEVIN